MARTRNPVALEGLDEVVGALRDLAKEMKGQKGIAQNPVRSAVRVAAKDMTERIREAAPERTGRMAESITLKLIPVSERDKFTSGGNSFEAFDIGPQRFAGYGGLVELGTSRTPAQPFMRPTLLGNENVFYRLFAGDLKKRIDRVAKQIERRNAAKVKK